MINACRFPILAVGKLPQPSQRQRVVAIQIFYGMWQPVQGMLTPKWDGLESSVHLNTLASST